MLDPITSLLAACVNCNPQDSGLSQPDVAICNADPRSHRNNTQHNSVSACISPPETTLHSSRDSSRLSFRGVEATDRTQRQNQPQTRATFQPVSPESSVAVAWSNAPASNVNNANNQILQFGSRGQAVSRLQTQLRQLGHYTGAIDGIYGQQTKAAVVQFQRSKKLQADGIVGAKTWMSLQAISGQTQPTKTPQAASPQNNPQAPNNSQSVQPTPQPSPSASPVAPTASEAQDLPTAQPANDSSQFPFHVLWIIGWGVIYSGGWVFILKDTVKEIKGFHFIVTGRKKNPQQTQSQVKTAQKTQPQAARKHNTAYSQSRNQSVPRVVIFHSQDASNSVDSPHSASEIQSTHSSQAQSIDSATSSTSVAPNSSFNKNGIDRSVDNSDNHSDSSSNINSGINLDVDSSNHSDISSNHSLSNHQRDNQNDRPAQEQFALHDPWQDEVDASSMQEQFALHDPWHEEAEDFSVQVLEVALADEGKVQPLRNVFIIAPRTTSTQNRPRPKKNLSIAGYPYYHYPTPVAPGKPEVVASQDVQNSHQQVKAG